MLTQKQENFCLNYFEYGNASEAALIAGYSARSIRNIASVNLTKANVQARIQELRDKAASEKIADFRERQEILTEIARGNLIDYQESGADGGYLSIGKESPNTRAISEITSRTEYDKEGAGAALVTKVKLHSPTQAIDLLNKMDKIYTEGAAIVNNNINIDKAVINAGERLENAITMLSARIREDEVPEQSE